MKGKDEVRCSTCFVSHFPRPNTLLCKGSKLEKKKKEDTNKHSLLRLRGGARNDKSKQIVDRAIANGKIHGINLHPGVENLGNGNCAFECVLDSINTRVIWWTTRSFLPHLVNLNQKHKSTIKCSK